MRFPIDDVQIGHWTDESARTGCTVVLLPVGTVASGEVRGGAPATREFDLLAPERTVEHVDAVVLTGGSAFGLAAADGVVAHLEEGGRGFPTGAGPVPIVVSMALYDLLEGRADVRPGPAEGRAAAEAATGEVATGRVGAGTGATVGTWRGRDHARPGGIGIGTARRGNVTVAAVVAVNASGDPDDGSASGGVADGTFDAWPGDDVEAFGGRQNTTIGVIVTNADLSKGGCLLVAQSGHDGLARALFPVHMATDGDALVAAATGDLDAGVDLVRVLAVAAVERAVRVAT
ncbi:MAG: P1 family peptidase [Actinobacteria bacterium]|nr:P1 family peptidase [Actinomycetota bacterium]